MEDRALRPKAKVRLRGLEWFPLTERVQGRHTTALKPAEAASEEALFAAAYLVSIVALPLLIAFGIWHPLDLPDFVYGVPAALAATLPWFMAQALCQLSGRRYYSFFALRTQLWVQLGGAAPSAIRRLRTWQR